MHTHKDNMSYTVCGSFNPLHPTSKEGKRRKRHIYPLRLRAEDPRETSGPAIDLGNSYLFIPSTDSFVQPPLQGGWGRGEQSCRADWWTSLSH